jgi:membrane-bound serine protease (ClpP class)
MRRSPRATLLLPLLLAGFTAPVGPLAIAAWGPPLLVLAGFLLLAVELFVLPGFGVAGAIGFLAMVAGVTLALMGPIPGPADVLVAIAAMASALTMTGVATWAVVSRLRAGHPLLGGRLSGDEYRAVLARPELEGVEGRALTDLRPAGTAEIAGERMDVVAEEGWVPAGSPVRVTRSEGWRLVVRAAPLPGGPAPAAVDEDPDPTPDPAPDPDAELP